MLEALATTPALLLGGAFLLSLLVGSFLNVVIHRLPAMLDRQWRTQAEELLAESGAAAPIQQADRAASAPPAKYNLLTPRSACPHCGALIRAHQNIPLLSWLLLGGRCASCRGRISARYPIVELVTALLSAAVVWRFGWHWQSAAALLVTWALVTLTVIDLDHQILPDTITLPLLWLGLLASLAWSAGLAPEGMGYGDFKLFGALGAWLGWQMLPLVLLLSAFTGAVVGMVLIAVRGRDRNVPMPFGPYLAAAGWIALMWGPQIVGGYLSVAGLDR